MARTDREGSVSGEEHRRALLAHVLASGRLAALAPFASDLSRYALLVIGADAIATLARAPHLAAMIVSGHLGRVRCELGVIDLSLVPRDAAEAGLSELARAVAPNVGFGEVRVVVLAQDGVTFGTVAIAPSTTGVLA